jgi:hypothetical protein
VPDARIVPGQPSRYLPLERLSWIFALIGTDLAVLIVAVQLGRGFFAPEAGRVVVEVGNGLGLLGEIGADNEVRDSLIQPQLFQENGRAFQPLADAAVRDSTLARLVDFGLLERRKAGRSTVWNVPPATRELVRADPGMDRVRADVLALRREILGSADRDRSNPSTEARTRAVSLQLSRRRAARGGNRTAGGGNRGGGGV